MTKRISKTIVAGINIIAFEEAMATFAKAEMRRTDILTKLETEMNRIKDKYAHEIIYLDEKKGTALQIVEAYCREQKENLFKKKRTLHTLHGSVGFRLGNPKLKIRHGNNWTNVMEKLKEKLPAYVRITEEPAKDMLIADRNNESVAMLMNELGLQIVQDEIFFVELKPRMEV